MFPDWLDVDTLRWLIPVVIVVIMLSMVLVARFVTTLVTKVLLLGILAVLGVSLWVQRADLGDCAETCRCSLFGQDIEIDAGDNPNCQPGG